MRVIAGKYKGRKLTAPQGRDIRPTTDKTKEAIFSILTSDIPEARVLDLFSGTGALGIEALSRGAKFCVFCDRSGESISKIIENLEHCGISWEMIRDRFREDLQGSDDGAEDTRIDATVCQGDIEKTLPRIGEIEESRFDVIMMDPPYGQGLCLKTMEIISQHGLLADEGVIVCEHRREEKLPETAGGFVRKKERRYGISMLSIYTRCC